MELIRSMIDRIGLAPKSNGPGLEILLHGALANTLGVRKRSTAKPFLDG